MPYRRICILLLGFVLDIIAGDPLWLSHPVQGMGKIITLSEDFFIRLLNINGETHSDIIKKRFAGFGIFVITQALTLSFIFLILYAAGKIHPYLKFFCEVIMCWQCIAAKSLFIAASKVYEALRADDIDMARYAVSMIVGRDTEKLDKEGITKAAVETVAESSSDGVVAPLFFLCLFGIYGGFFYKAANTMDSMMGYKNDKYLYMGSFAARFDDVLNFIPSRLSALMMIIASSFLSLDFKSSFRIFLRDRNLHLSPNAGQTESVMAGALGLELGGDAVYFGRLVKKARMGDRKKTADYDDIKKACFLMYLTSTLSLLFFVLILIIYGSFAKRFFDVFFI